MKKAILAITLITLLTLLLGCTGNDICGDTICSEDENKETCPQDCGEPANNAPPTPPEIIPPVPSSPPEYNPGEVRQ